MSKMEDMTREVDRLCIAVVADMEHIYKNKSSDEYKMHGDITLSPGYKDMERMLADLALVKEYPKTASSDLKALFNLLHRQVFKVLVPKYIEKPEETNIMITMIFTASYRLIVGELSRIYASIEATTTGFVYKPDKITQRLDMSRVVTVFKNKIESKLDSYIKDTTKSKLHQEGAFTDGVTNVLNFVGTHLNPFGITTFLIGKFSDFIKPMASINPISFIDNLFTRHYDKKIARFDELAKLYEATKEAYEDYMKLPEAQRKRKTEHKYHKLMNKYNIKMKHLSAKLAHYDQRAAVEARENQEKLGNATVNNIDASTPTTSSSSTSTNSNNDDFDF